MTPSEILRNGYNQAVKFDAPIDMRERLLAAAVEAETHALIKLQADEAERVATLENKLKLNLTHPANSAE